MRSVIPAGLLDNGAEFFADPDNHNIAHVTYQKRVYRVHQAPEQIKAIVLRDMDSNPEKVLVLNEMGFVEQEALMEKYCSCVVGAFDPNNDIEGQQLSHHEYRLCSLRGTCPGTDKVCNPLRVSKGTLTYREVEVLTLIGRRKLNKEVAFELGISEETVKRHINKILKKSDLMNKMDLITLAHQKNLIGKPANALDYQTPKYTTSEIFDNEYIVTKLKSWLSQRSKALETVPGNKKVLEIAKLKVMLSFYLRQPAADLLSFIINHYHLFDSVAPTEGSTHRNYYQNTIEPLLKRCHLEFEAANKISKGGS